VLLVRQIALVRASPVQLRPRCGIERVRETEGAGVLRRCLAVGAELRCPGGSRGRVPEHGRRVADLLGVMREPRKVGLSGRWLGQGGKRRAVECEASIRCQGLLDRPTRELVAEADRARP
jgi:hypothetical protein